MCACAGRCVWPCLPAPCPLCPISFMPLAGTVGRVASLKFFLSLMYSLFLSSSAHSLVTFPRHSPGRPGAVLLLVLFASVPQTCPSIPPRSRLVPLSLTPCPGFLATAERSQLADGSLSLSWPSSSGVPMKGASRAEARQGLSGCHVCVTWECTHDCVILTGTRGHTCHWNVLTHVQP